jgi:hypothetical protein
MLQRRMRMRRCTRMCELSLKDELVDDAPVTQRKKIAKTAKCARPKPMVPKQPSSPPPEHLYAEVDGYETLDGFDTMLSTRDVAERIGILRNRLEQTRGSSESNCMDEVNAELAQLETSLHHLGAMLGVHI